MAIEPERIDALFSEWDRSDSPGCALGVIQDGELRYARGYGLADLERGASITPDSLFDLGSTGKQFTATVISILAARGRLRMEDSLRDHVPEMPAYAQAITLRQLVHHTSGLRDYLDLMELCDLPLENAYHEEALLDLIARQEGLNFEPGEEHLYSNSGYFLLGVVAQRAGGQHLTALIRELIYEPLGMRRSTFNRDYRPLVPGRALSYTRGPDGGFTNEISLCGGFGDGPAYSCVEDLVRWDGNFYANRLNGGQPDLLETLHAPGRLNNGERLTYAGGLIVEDYRGLRSVSHGGSWAGYRAELLRFPERRTAVICLCNLAKMEPEELARRVADVCLEADFEGRPVPEASEQQAEAREPIPLEPAQLRRLAGAYASRELRTTYVLSEDGGLLHLQRTPFSPREALVATAPDRFHGKDIELRFTPRGLSAGAGRVRGIHFERA